MPNEPIERIAIFGFGEAGGILGQDLAARGLAISTYDILLDQWIEDTAQAMLARWVREDRCLPRSEEEPVDESPQPPRGRVRCGVPRRGCGRSSKRSPRS